LFYQRLLDVVARSARAIHLGFLVAVIFVFLSVTVLKDLAWQRAIFALFSITCVLLALVIILDVFCLAVSRPRSILNYAYVVLLPGKMLRKASLTNFRQLVAHPAILTIIFVYIALCFLVWIVVFSVAAIPSS